MAEHGLNQGLTGTFSRIKQAETLAALGWLFLLLSEAVAGITIALVNQDWGTLWRTSVFGLLLGWSLGIFRKSIWATTFIVLAVGALYILLFSGGLMGKVIDAALEFVQLLPSLWNSIQNGKSDLSPLVSLLQGLSASAWNIIVRVQAWVTTLFSDQSTYDPVAASLTWNVLVWLTAAWAGWMVEARRNALLAATPAILLSVGTLAYGGGRTSLVIYLMIGSLLLLLAVVQQSLRRKSWEEANVAYPSKKGRQIIHAAWLITIALVLFSAFASFLSIHRIQEWIDELRKPSAGQSNDLGKSLGIAPGGTATSDVFTVARSPGLPEDHLIGSGPDLSQRVVMTVSVQNLADLSRDRQPPLYWRAFTYNIYTGDGWSSSATEQNPYRANQPLQAEYTSGQILIQQQVFPVEDLDGTIYAAGEPLTVNLPSETAWRSNADLFGIQIDRAVSYEVNSLLPRVDEQVLRDAGQKYPDWVRQRYLALPPDIPGRVRALAIKLTAPERTPYDRARAIESYLRTFPYTLDVPRPHVNRDVVDYFLFDLKKGYCDYYASSMVVLARAAGIPARLVIGYANGTYNLNSKRFVVTEADAHSWVEIYFPGIGWVTFEPTSGRPPLKRADHIPAAPSQSATHPAPQQNEISLHVWRVLLGGLALAGLLGVAWVVFQEIRLNDLAEQAVAVEIYKRMRHYSTLLLGVSSGLGDTPYEFTALLIDRLHRLSLKTAFMPQLVHDLQSLMDKIVQVLYRPSLLRTARNADVLQKWRSLRWKLWLVWILERWRALTNRFGWKQSL